MATRRTLTANKARRWRKKLGRTSRFKLEAFAAAALDVLIEESATLDNSYHPMGWRETNDYDPVESDGMVHAMRFALEKAEEM